MGVFAGNLRSGQRLIVQQLARTYEVSPTPVREALVELARLGLVDLLPNRGAIVRPVGPAEVGEISQIRRLLETEAARNACGRIPPDELSALDRELRRLEALPRDQAWDRDARAADTRLHGLIAESCGNLRLAVEIGQYCCSGRYAMCATYVTPGRTTREPTTFRSTWRSSVRCSRPMRTGRPGPWTGTSDRPR
jgi:DNA-binding GntR family transcriptional regulator